MISRYSLHTTADLRDRFALASGLPKGVKPRYNIHPTVQAPVIVNRDGDYVVEQMGWGLVPKGTKNMNSVFRYKTFNVPSEKILSKHSWETAARYNRCLVPANGFYQLAEHDGKKQAYYIQVKNAPLVALAGICSTWGDTDASHSTYSIITSEAPHSLRAIARRMPIILSPSEETQWLDASLTNANALFGMLRPISDEQLIITEVGADIHSLKIESPKLISSL